jgi:hypothetical protein
MSNWENFRVHFQSDLEQDASTMSTCFRRDAGRSECFALRTHLDEKASFSHARNISREEAGLLNICIHFALMS